MHHHVNYLAVLVSGTLIFALGGLWYSKAMFATRWMALQEKTMQDLQAQGGGASASMFIQVFLCGLIVAWVLAMIISATDTHGWLYGAHCGALLWLGFTAATSYGTALFSFKPKALWAIDTGYNLVSMLVAGAVLGAWQ